MRRLTICSKLMLHCGEVVYQLKGRRMLISTFTSCDGNLGHADVPLAVKRS
jgi:hypothetical protein